MAVSITFQHFRADRFLDLNHGVLPLRVGWVAVHEWTNHVGFTPQVKLGHEPWLFFGHIVPFASIDKAAGCCWFAHREAKLAAGWPFVSGVAREVSHSAYAVGKDSTPLRSLDSKGWLLDFKEP